MGGTYPHNPLFYGEWSDESSELLLACDEELQMLCESLTKFDLTSVRSLRLHYESDTPGAMTRKISGIKSLRDLRSPMIQSGDGWIPDLNSRYFMADFPYGLAIIKEIADLAGLTVRTINETLNWYYKIPGGKEALRA